MKKLVLVISLLLNVVLTTVWLYDFNQRNEKVDVNSTVYTNCGTDEAVMVTVTTYADGSQKVTYCDPSDSFVVTKD